MARYEIDMRGIDELENSEQMRVMLRKVAEAAAEGARRRAPVDTGRLRDSISSEDETGRAWYGTDVDYALFQELGTRYQPAQPYLRPALDDAKREL